MKNVIFTFILICLTFLPSQKALSNDESKATSQIENNNEVNTSPVIPFLGKASINFSRNKGNVDEEAIEYGFLLSKDDKFSETYFKLKGKKTEKQQKCSKEEHEFSVFKVYHFNESSGVYGKLTSYQNEPRGYKHQWRLGMGYLYTWYQFNDQRTPKAKREINKKFFKSRIGFQIRDSDYTTGADNHQNYLLLGSRAQYPIMENVSLFIEVNYGVNISHVADYEIENALSLIFYVNKKIDLKIDYEIFYSHIPVLGKKSTDNSLGTSLIYKF